MSNLSHTIRRFNRFELKYLITLKQAELFKKSLRAFLVADEHGGNNGSYGLDSLYYNSPDFRCYWEKVDGIKFRRKLRIRRYKSEVPADSGYASLCRDQAAAGSCHPKTAGSPPLC